MVGSDSYEGVGSAVEQPNGDETGWSLIASYDGASAVVDAALDVERGTELTRREICEVADVPYKTLYLSGTVDALVEAGLFEQHERDAEESTFTVDRESRIYQAATAFAAAIE